MLMGGVAKSRVPIVFALMCACIFRKVPSDDLLASEGALGLGYQRLAFWDKVMIEEINASLAASPSQRSYSMFDDTHYSLDERHVFFFSHFDVVRKTPVSKLVSLKPTAGKDAATNAKEGTTNIKSMNLPAEKHGGAPADHVVGGEGKELDNLIVAAALLLLFVVRTGSPGRRVAQVVAHLEGPRREDLGR
jgi:hypothetical protein